MLDQILNPPPPPIDAWFYASGQQQLGPLTITQATELVRSGQLRADTLVWKKGMKEWTQLRFSSLGEIVSADLPPPIPRNAPLPPGHSKKETPPPPPGVDKAASEPTPASYSTFGKICAVVGFLLIGLILIVAFWAMMMATHHSLHEEFHSNVPEIQPAR